MGRDIPLGRIAGIRVGMAWSVPLVAAIYVVVLATNRLPFDAPGQPRTSYWVAGLVGAALFFVSLLAHEVGHALVARREGIGVLDIRLWLLGGVARLEHEADTAGAELRIAAVGPLTSGAVGLVFLFLHDVLDGQLGSAALYGALFGWLGWVNLVLAAFNLLPGAPLDGGRVLGAILWRVAGDQGTGQRSAAAVGQVLGAALLGTGGFLLFGTGDQNGLWLLLVGMFIFTSASSERRASPLMDRLRQVSLSQVMDPHPLVLPAGLTLHDLVAHSPDLGGRDTVVVQEGDGRLVGVLTAATVRSIDPATWPYLRLGEVAFPIDRMVIARTDSPVLSAVQRATNAPMDRILVLHPDGRLAGLSGPEAAERAEVLHHVAPAPPLPPPPPPPLPGPAPGAAR